MSLFWDSSEQLFAEGRQLLWVNPSKWEENVAEYDAGRDNNNADTNNNDAEIIRLAQSDDEENYHLALELLDQEYGKEVQKRAAQKLPDHFQREAEDIRQEVAVAVLLKIKKGELAENGSLYALLLKIAKRKVADIVRKAARRKENSSVDVAAIAQAHYDNPEAIAELKEVISTAYKNLSVRELHVFETRMEFVRQEKRRPRFKKLAELVVGHAPTDNEIDAVKHMYYRAVKKVKEHLTRTGHWTWN